MFICNGVSVRLTVFRNTAPFVALLLLLACQDQLLYEFDEYSRISAPINIQFFDSHSGNGFVILNWTTGKQPVDIMPGSNPSQLPNVTKVRILMSESNPESGFGTIFETDRDAEDSLKVENLVNGKTYYFRVAVYDENGKNFGVSRPIATSPGSSPVELFSVPSNQSESPVYVTNISWASDNMRIAFIKETAQGRPNIYIYDVENGNITKVTNYSSGNYRLMSVAWSPNDSLIAYCYTPSITMAEIDYRIWTIPTDGNNLRSVTTGRVDFDPTWINDKEMLFCRGTYDPPNIPEIYRAEIGRPSEMMTNSQLLRKYSPSVNRQSGIIVFSGESTTSHERLLYTLPLSKGEFQMLTVNEYWRDIQPSWVEGTTQVVFSSDRSGHYEIWMLEMSSGATKQLTRGLVNLQRYHAKVSNDAKYFAFLEETASLKANLKICNFQALQ